MRFLFLVSMFFALSCAKANKEEKAEPLTKIQLLRNKYDAKISEAKQKFDVKSGWPSAIDCDATLWAGLAKAAGVDTVDLEQADYGSGEIHRVPSPDDCYASGSTSVSRDMLLGYTYGMFRTGNAEAIQLILNFGEHHSWIMGKPEASLGEVLLTGNLMGAMARATCEMNSYCPIYKAIMPLHSKSDKDYVRHLTVLYILLNGEIDSPVKLSLGGAMGNITTSDLDILKWHAEQDPKDLLFQAAVHLYSDGDFNEVADELLADEFYVPSYVRGNENYPLVHWLFVTKLILQRLP